ncbi:vacuolar-type H+-ATPase subunit I/STV1 [Anaerosolibacter carboniphilus]|uniref:Vacuolar-type H+-ATPase subunit I/STV1 n=1 Tax=Anaerosolibacter carboniphilus TaxID=1417629 RepID=A0A841KQ24_9FIRM|nr:hypothetical protein [Anaerosolibacter carboniphilus]MBB6215431.1 vacuolar-type H+-ATPase subunit I/STV1 [Anaerosolibacter carboniphilus]
MKNVRNLMRNLAELLFREVETPEEILYISDVEVQERLNYIKKLSRKVEKYKAKIEVERQYLEARLQERQNYQEDKKAENKVKKNFRLIS